MPKQDFDLLDYLGAPIVAVVFGVVLFFLCVIINYTLITKRDDLTAFEKLGSRINLRLGPHSMTAIRRGGYASTFAKEEEPLKKDGMVYFSSLDELADHQAGQLDFCLVPLQNFEDHDGKVKTLLCHDMQGGYLCYDGLSGASVSREEQTLYTFFHWWYIDVFVYFSHNFVTVPPIAWTNQAHRHGVVVLGTLITESDGGAAICREIFAEKSKAEKLAAQLAALCVEFGFDGWLVNIENPIEDASHLANLKHFLAILRADLRAKVGAHSYLVWYDSVSADDGKLAWQNELNEKNSTWFEAVDALFLNYPWKAENLQKSLQNAKERHCEVFAGIDVFGRGQLGDGGWNCAEALRVVRSAHLSAAIFAPGWICEKFPDACLFAHSFRFWDLLRGLVTANRRIHQPFATDFHHGLDAGADWFCLANAQLQPFFLSDGRLVAQQANAEQEGGDEGGKPDGGAIRADSQGLRLEGEEEHVLFLCDIKAHGHLTVVARADAPAAINVYLATGSVISLRTCPEENGGECRREIPMATSADEPPVEFTVTRITAACESADRPAYISFFSIG